MPEMVNFLLIFALDHQRNPGAEFEHRATIQCHVFMTGKIEADSEHGSRLEICARLLHFWKIMCCVMDSRDGALGGMRRSIEEIGVIFGCFLGLVVEPKTGSDLVAGTHFG